MTTAEPTTKTTATRPWSVSARVVVSLLLMWHLTAMLIGPLSLPPSVLASSLRTIFRPYLDSLDMGHAYKFFAPDPGPSHLVQYDLELADGTHRKGTFPDRHEHWPRLLYHRHFMLSEFIATVAPQLPTDASLNPPSTMPPAVQHEYAKQQAYAQSYANHLLHTSGARRVTLQLRRHMLPSPEEVLKGTPLDHPESYIDRPLGTFTGEHL